MDRRLPDWQSDVVGLAPFAGIRLIAMDLDGTLLRHGEAQVSESIAPLARRLRHYRYRADTTIATGRALTGVQHLLAHLPIRPDAPLVLHNGSVVVRRQDFRIIHRCVIPVTSVIALWEIAADHQVSLLSYCYEDPLWQWGTSAIRWETVLGWPFGRRFTREFNGIGVSWQRTTAPPRDVSPCAVAIDLAGNPEKADLLRQEVEEVPGVSCTQSGGNLIEVRPAGSNKGVGLEAAARSLGLELAAVLALGDNDNDVEMLSWAGIGVAVEGGSALAVSASDYVCNHEAVEGAIEVLRLVREAKRYYPDRSHQIEPEAPRRGPAPPDVG